MPNTKDETMVFVEYLVISETESWLNTIEEELNRNSVYKKIENPKTEELMDWFRMARQIHLDFNASIPNLTDEDVETMRKAIKDCHAQKVTIKSTETENLLQWTKVFPKHICLEWEATPEVFEKGLEPLNQVITLSLRKHNKFQFTAIDSKREVVTLELMQKILENKQMRGVCVKVGQLLEVESYVEEWKTGERDISYWLLQIPENRVILESREQFERIKDGVMERLIFTISSDDKGGAIEFTYCK